MVHGQELMKAHTAAGPNTGRPVSLSDAMEEASHARKRLASLAHHAQAIAEKLSGMQHPGEAPSDGYAKTSGPQGVVAALTTEVRSMASDFHALESSLAEIEARIG